MTDPITIPDDPNEESVLCQYLEAVVDTLELDVVLATLNIITEDQKDIENEISRSLGLLTGGTDASGICIIVLAPTLKASRLTPGPVFDNSVLSIVILEQPALNRASGGSGRSGICIAERVAKALHLKSPDGYPSCLVCTTVQIVEWAPDPSVVARRVDFNFKLGV
jgi:hypothetical protein